MNTTANITSSDSIGMDFDYTSAFKAASLVVAQCPSWAVAIGYLGVSFAMILSNFGSAVSILSEPSIFFSRYSFIS
jgi:hypothetical protein